MCSMPVLVVVFTVASLHLLTGSASFIVQKTKPDVHDVDEKQEAKNLSHQAVVLRRTTEWEAKI